MTGMRTHRARGCERVALAGVPREAVVGVLPELVVLEQRLRQQTPQEAGGQEGLQPDLLQQVTRDHQRRLKRLHAPRARAAHLEKAQTQS
eukprot:112789-Pyramimonas_sp.AAC.1